MYHLAFLLNKLSYKGWKIKMTALYKTSAGVSTCTWLVHKIWNGLVWLSGWCIRYEMGGCLKQETQYLLCTDWFKEHKEHRRIAYTCNLINKNISYLFQNQLSSVQVHNRCHCHLLVQRSMYSVWRLWSIPACHNRYQIGILQTHGLRMDLCIWIKQSFICIAMLIQRQFLNVNAFWPFFGFLILPF